jgi:hypothetical protein
LGGVYTNLEEIQGLRSTWLLDEIVYPSRIAADEWVLGRAAPEIFLTKLGSSLLSAGAYFDLSDS